MGASIGAEDISFYQPLFPLNDIMRVFPVNQAITDSGGTTKTVLVFPGWTDSRLAYCQAKRVIPFLSSKVDGWAAGIDWVKTQLLNMPAWILNDDAMFVYCTDRHEPEGDLGTGTAGQDAYKANFGAFYTMVQSLPANIRAKVKCGPILTKTWTENTAAGKGNNDYSLYDPGIGDFFGVDMYVNTGSASAVVTPATLPTAAAFTSVFAAYKHDAGDTRPRIWPELGLIGMPADTDGSARANWIQSIYDLTKTWKVGVSGWTMPWSFTGWIWWNQEGKATGTVATVGLRRDFPLDERTVDTASAAKIVPPLPLNKFNALLAAERTSDPRPPAQATPPPDTTPPAINPYPNTGVQGKYAVGATMAKADIATYQAALASNQVFRVFPNGDTHLPPAWTDARFVYCQSTGAIPFVSSNIDGDATKFAALVTWLSNMPAWVTKIYITDRHEPENNFPNNPAQFIANYTAWWTNVILALPAAIRAKVKAGPVLTLNWITDATKGNGNYAQYDPGPTVSDFYGIDMYMQSWKPGSPTLVADAYVDPTAFLAGVKAYKYNSGDTRERIFPEFGAIGIPTDPTGVARANWLTAVLAQLDSWTEAAQGWKFSGLAWWNTVGATGAALTPIGASRYFYLDKYQASDGTLKPYVGVPAPPVTAYNQAALAHASATPPPTSGDDGTSPIPGIVVDTSDLPANEFGTARLLAADYLILITDAQLNVLGDPIWEWSYLQVTLRWKEPGSGQFKVPNFPYIRAQVRSGARVVIVRRVLGVQSVLISGPIEQILRERSDDNDDNGGVGQLTVTFTDDLAWIAVRVAYPDPTKEMEAQSTDYWIYSGNPEAGMLQLVETQAGPSALPARRVPGLRTAVFSGISGTGTVKLGATTNVAPRARLEPCTDVLRTMATTGVGAGFDPDSLGFRTRQTVDTAGTPIILFEVLRSRDLSGQVHFSFGMGNLKYYSFEEDAPTATVILAGGQYDITDANAGADKFVKTYESTTPTSLEWGRFEEYMARPGSDVSAGKVIPDVASEFVDKAATARLAISAADTVDCRANVHYGVGDIVSVELDIGEFIIAPVQTISIQAYPTSGEVVGTTIGDQSASYNSVWIRKMRAMENRVGVLERRGSAIPA